MPSYFYHLILEVLSHPQASAAHTPSKDAQRHPCSDASFEEYALKLKSLRESVRPFRRKKAKPAPNVATDLANHLATTSLQDTEIHTDHDPRTDTLSIQGVDMVHNEISKGIGSNVISGLATKGKYVPLDLGLTDSVYGIVHLYRDAEETPSLGQDNHDQDLFYLQGVGSSSHAPASNHPSAPGLAHASGSGAASGPAEETLSLEDCTTLCILAVPSYLSPSDFLGYVGEQTMEDPEACHVVFVKDVEIQVSSSAAESKFPDMKNDPFPFSDAPSTMSSKPLAPPTPSLIELPTCPRWKGSGCPVCRYTQDDLGKRNVNFAMDEGPSECSVCHSEVNLWICLICGNIGCGRYDGAHAFDHYKETSHSFAMDLTSQRVWDYLGDGYVHRIIQGKSDGKLLELPARGDSALDPPDWSDAVPREKFENISVEYTHLLTSQLESQRVYFEEQVERAADKASKASASAISAQEAAERLARDMEKLQSQYDSLTRETIPSLERDKARAERRAEKFESMSRTMEKQWREEKTMNASLMERVEFLDAEVSKLKAANEDLAEQNRDLTFFISGTERLKNQGEDVVEGTVSVPDPPTSSSKRKGKRKAKK
ncbi:RING and UBP finger domain-containing protein [Trichophyton rubrum]|uniref:RING and UBP finger domain-containing protein n=1 Tax=Trichophyton rubrum TaxID=5551 RepID=A0A178F723_TRIRU|nr:RING and UBP finger domain-containing protein [Trichophyton rubrum]